MFYETHILSNGIRLIHKPDNAPVAYCGIGINAGTRDEKEHEQGLAHFAEHMLFKGTHKRKAWHILNRLESVGGEINAYTTKEETFVYATVLKDDFERAMELTADIVFNSIFPSNELEKEIDVVLDEINSYRDSPSELIFDDFEELIFNNYPIGKNILGNELSLQTFTSESLKTFVCNNYCTTEMVFFSLGDIPFDKIIRLAEKYLGAIPYSAKKEKREKPLLYAPQQIAQSKDTFQTHYMLGNRAYNLYEKDKRLALYLLNNILGGPGMNSLLNLALRERNALVYNVESNVTSYSDTGVWNVYFGCDPKNKKRCEKLVFKELELLKDTGISENQLQRSKKQLIGQLAISSENKESLALSIGKSFLHFNKVDSTDEINEQIRSVSARTLLDVANEIFDTSSLTSLIYTK
jgi:predicted Zn-dependent peptidase